MFWNNRFTAMAWRYPQPRILSKVRIFPVPYKSNQTETSSSVTNVNKSNDQQVLCFLEYWSDCHGSYQSYAEFYLSESEMCQLELLKNIPQTAVSSTWRVVLSFSDSVLNENYKNNFISPRALAACMRIDSYFNPILIPQLQATINCFQLNVSVYNQFNKKLALVMPEKMRHFTPDGLIPDNQCFINLNAQNTNVHLVYWFSQVNTIKFKTLLKCHILDYGTLTMHPIIEPITVRLLLEQADHINVNAIIDHIKFKLCPGVFHTLAISSQLWTQHWYQIEKTNYEPPDMIIITRYVICNDTNLNLRIGQVNTEENILISSRFLHLYCWKSHKTFRRIRVAIENNNWSWSEPINIDEVCAHQIPITFSDSKYILFVTIKLLSSTQKQIIFSGQLIVCNMLLDHFELKILPQSTLNKTDSTLKNTNSYIINGKSTAPSICIDYTQKLTLRLRFLNLDAAWSGDIPLEENAKGYQPWLVKIPLQERGQFLSIWCRIIDKKSNNQQILVMLWPLFMVRSQLPVNTKAQIETTALNVKTETMIKGRGELQQLYCPGTIDHSHNIIFNLGVELSNNTPAEVPLNYSLIDQKVIFKKIDNENIYEILEYFEQLKLIQWPYVESILHHYDWNVDEQPVTNVQIKYQNVCLYSNSLLVEFIPWCLIINTLGIPIVLIVDENELCRINHYGIITPPNLQSTFNIGVEIEDALFVSPLLQLATKSWNKSFYMPKFNGIIPSEGTIDVPVKCNLQMCLMSITSKITHEPGILQILPKYILTNCTKLQLDVTCIALPKNIKKVYDMSDMYQLNSILIDSHLNKKNVGIPLINWHCLEEISDSVEDYTFHLIITFENKFAQSSPINIESNHHTSRKSICLYSHTENIPLALITQENKGQIILSIHHDIHPQMLIINKCSQPIFCAQCDSNGAPVIENSYINWLCGIYSDTEIYYTMPSLSENFPSVDSTFPDKLILAVKSEESTPLFQWSHEINISIYNNEQYVRIPQFGDVKLSIKNVNFTIVITIDSVTEVEINAQDIRSRLMQYKNSTGTLTYPKQNVEPIIKNEINTQKSNELKISHVDSQKKSKIQLRPVQLYSYAILRNVNLMDKIKQGTQHDGIKPLPGASSNNLDNNNDDDDDDNDDVNHPSKIELNLIVKHFNVTLCMDNSNLIGFELDNLTTLFCEYVTLEIKKDSDIDCSINIGNIQCDNQLFQTGSYDFPVVLIGENKCSYSIPSNFDSSSSLVNIIKNIQQNSDFELKLNFGIWNDKNLQQNIIEIQEIKLKCGLLSLFIEDIFITNLVDYINILSPAHMVLWSLDKTPKNLHVDFGLIEIPEHFLWESKIIAKPLYLRKLTIEQVSTFVSVHSSVKVYIALDRSPINFNQYERTNIITTSFQLGRSLTVQYLSDAIFGAGWVVGSLELLGNPGGLARTVGTGLFDFISMPYNGFVQGPWAFLVGITNGSASLMRHVTAGTLDSVTKMASSVARNLDRLSMDKEHLQRTENMRRSTPENVTQGFMQGLTGFGISLLGALGGIAHHPLQSVMTNGASPSGVISGVGVGLMGVITKPISGAAELVARTGQGLLHGAGWNLSPKPKLSYLSASNRLQLYEINKNSVVKYKWKLLQNIPIHNRIVTVAEAVFDSKQIELIIAFEALVIVNLGTDDIEKVISVIDINDIYAVADDPTEIRISMIQPMTSKTPPQNMETFEIEMDPVSRARVADYVKNSSGLVQMSPLASTSNSDDEYNNTPTHLPNTVVNIVESQPSLIFYVNPEMRNYLCDMLVLVKQQYRNNTFKIF